MTLEESGIQRWRSRYGRMPLPVVFVLGARILLVSHRRSAFHVVRSAIHVAQFPMQPIRRSLASVRASDCLSWARTTQDRKFPGPIDVPLSARVSHWRAADRFRHARARLRIGQRGQSAETRVSDQEQRHGAACFVRCSYLVWLHCGYDGRQHSSFGPNSPFRGDRGHPWRARPMSEEHHAVLERPSGADVDVDH